MSTIDQQFVSPTEGSLSSEIREYMLETARWARLIAIVGFIGIGIMVIIAFFAMFTGMLFGVASNLEVPIGLIGLIYLAVSALYFFPVYYLYKAATGWKVGLMNNDEASLTSGFRNWKSHYKFLGIMVVIILSLYGLMFLTGLAIALG